MAIARWSPFSDLAEMRDEMERVFDRFFPSARREILPAAGWIPSVDVFERDGNVVVEAELPGIKKDEVDISLQDSTLTISGEMKREEEKKEEGYYRHERHYGRFMRNIPLPAPVKAEGTKAKFEEGVLQITLPKAEEEAKGKKIPVE